MHVQPFSLPELVDEQQGPILPVLVSHDKVLLASRLLCTL